MITESSIFFQKIAKSNPKRNPRKKKKLEIEIQKTISNFNKILIENPKLTKENLFEKIEEKQKVFMSNYINFIFSSNDNGDIYRENMVDCEIEILCPITGICAVVPLLFKFKNEMPLIVHFQFSKPEKNR